MRKILLTVITSLCFLLTFSQITERIADKNTIPDIIPDNDATVFIVVRHGEKMDNSKDPHLDSTGLKRAQTLQLILSKIALHNIYATPYNRTKETVKPTADSKNQQVHEYSPKMPFIDLADSLLSANKGKKALIAGHSNTVPAIVKALGKSDMEIAITEDSFDHLYIIIIPKKGTPVIKSFKYGQETP